MIQVQSKLTDGKILYKYETSVVLSTEGIWAARQRVTCSWTLNHFQQHKHTVTELNCVEY